MRDDYIQGILFSRSDLVDLRRMNASDRRMYKMLATKNTLRDWSTRRTSHVVLEAVASPGTVIKPRIIQ